MSFRATFHIIGLLLLFLSITLLTPIPFSLIDGDGSWWFFLLPAVGSALLGTILFKGFKAVDDLTIREGFGIIAFGWLFFAIVGAIPYVLSGSLPYFIDAFFESMSGFTTTGSTVIEDVTVLDRSVLFWRALTQWIGGMGIIVLSLAILPFLGIGGMQLLQAEMPGPTKDRLGSRVQDSAKVLWGVYFIFTAVYFALLLLGGVPFFDAICHSFTVLATGGFSTHNESFMHYQSGYIHWVTIFFMFLAGVNFSLHYAAMRGDWKGYFKREEFLTFCGILFVSTLGVFFLVYPLYDDGWTALRDAAFQVMSIGTTAGFISADYDLWPVLAQYIIILLMFIGGCAGSTSGGWKVVRVLLVFKQSVIQVFRMIHPKGIKYLMLDHEAVPLNIIHSISGYFNLNICIFAIASLLMASLGMDFVSASVSVIASLLNIGPGLGSVGPTETYAGVPGFGKLVLAFCMLIGRLEVFTIFVLFIPSFWRR